MPKGERGTSKPYLRGTIWWIKYYVPGEEKPRRESSESNNKQDAVRLLNKRRTEIDDRKVSSTNATVGDLLELYLSDQRRQKRHSYKSADGFVRLHLNPHSAPSKHRRSQRGELKPLSSRNKRRNTPAHRLTAGSRHSAAHTPSVWRSCLHSSTQRPTSSH
jgi:hypothetical protein